MQEREIDLEEREDITRLRIVLTVVGVMFLAGPFTLLQLWPSGFTWDPRHTEYELFLLGTFAVLGIFLLNAARDPTRHLSLIWFAAWFSLAHGGIALIQSLRDVAERPNLLGEVPALILVGIGLMWLTPRRSMLNPVKRTD